MKMPEKFAKKKDAKTEKAGAAVEEEHLLSLVDVEYEYDNDKGVAKRFLACRTNLCQKG